MAVSKGTKKIMFVPNAFRFKVARSPWLAPARIKNTPISPRQIYSVDGAYSRGPGYRAPIHSRYRYDGEGREASFQNQSGSGGGGGGSGQFRRNELMTLNAVKDSNIGQGDNADFFSCRGTIIFIKSDNIMYTACPGDKCNKKVTETPSGDWRCEKCDRSYPEPDPRYV